MLRRMLYPGSQVPGGAARMPTAIVTTPEGEAVAGEVAARDEFTIAVIDADGRYRSWPTDRVRFTSAIRSSRSRRAARALHRRRDARRARVPAHASLGRSHEIQTANTRPIAALGARLTRRRTAGPRITATTRAGATARSRRSRPTMCTLALAWAFQTNRRSSQVDADSRRRHRLLDGPDNLWAIDPRSGRQIWRYSIRQTTRSTSATAASPCTAAPCYLTTPDAHLLAFDRFSGKQLWNVEIADSTRGFWATNAPLVIRDHVIVGVSGDFDNLPGILPLVRPRDGRGAVDVLQHAAGRHAGVDRRRRDGRADVDDGHLRPRARPALCRHGQPDARAERRPRPGDNKWTCSIVAFDPDTGELEWGFQVSPHDTHDWDAAEVPVLVDAKMDGATASCCSRPRATATTWCSTARRARTCSRRRSPR